MKGRLCVQTRHRSGVNPEELISSTRLGKNLTREEVKLAFAGACEHCRGSCPFTERRAQRLLPQKRTGLKGEPEVFQCLLVFMLQEEANGLGPAPGAFRHCRRECARH